MGSRKNLRLTGLLAVLIAGAAVAAFAGGGQDPAPTPIPASLAEADKLYLEKSYAGALAGYEKLLQANQVPADQLDRVEYQRNVSLGKSQKWDQALEASLEFVKARRGTLWEARGLYWLGRLFLGVPHEGYRVGGKLYRGSDVPKVEADGPPEHVALWEQDSKNAIDALEAARVFYARFRGGDRPPRSTPEEEIQLNFDLGRVILNSGELWQWAQQQKWAPPSDPTWKIDPKAEYDPKWAPPKKLLFLYEQIDERAMEPGEPKTRPHSAALGLFAKALFLRQYLQMMPGYAIKYENQKQVKIPFPYEDLKAEEPLRELVKRFPNDTIRDQSQYTLGLWAAEESKFTQAVTEFRRFVEERPQSKWVTDAKFQLEQITRRSLSLDNNGAFPVGQAPRINAYYRSVGTIQFELYRVDLEKVIARPELLNDPHVNFNNFGQSFSSLKEGGNRFGPLVKQWDFKTKDNGDYTPRSEVIELPTKEVGAYILLASAPSLRSGTLIMISDLAVVQKLDRDEGLFFVTHSKTGAPVKAADLIVKQWWQEGNTRRTVFTRGKSDADGVFTMPLQRAPGRVGHSVSALAQDGSRYAVTDQIQSWWGGDNPELYRVYSQTDRAVYRPQQTVYYRHMLTLREQGALKPAVNQKVSVEVRDPRGQVIHSAQTTSSEFGSVNGQFGLSSDPPLGEYSIQVTLPEKSQSVAYNGANRFRVEEYKKPEFEVTVKPTADRVRIGDAVSAQVNASYYFGGPVPNAKVTYRVHRNYWAQRYEFPRPFDFIYRYYSGGDYDTSARSGEVIKQGETKTDAQGMAEISFPTAADAKQFPGSDLSYTIEADVQDASRRVISGSGAVKATRHDVAVFVDFKHGYATKGDEVDMEVMTLNPSDQPVSVPGHARIYRYPDTPDGKEKLVHEQALKTDKQGRAFFKWPAKAGGRYRAAFETKDTANLPVSGSTDVWVSGPELNNSRFQFQQVMLRTKELYYEEGDKAKVLLVTPSPDCTVLLTREVNNEISERKVVRVTGRSTEITFPLTNKDVPNVYIQAVMIRDNQMFQATQELFVPPVKQFATVSVTSAKGRFEPGERGELKLVAKDWQGRPLRTELSVSVTDASLAYIQKDYAPDVRVFYYGDRRSVSIAAGGSLHTRFNPVGEDKQPHGQYQMHEWTEPEGMGQLPDWPGQNNLGGMAYFGRYRGMRGGMMGGMGGGGFGGGGGRMLMSESRSDFFAAAPAAGAAGPVGLSARANRPLSKTLADKKDGLAEADGEGGGLRTQFADTAFWTPAVVTDAKGEATVEVTWPDNLTKWRAAALGTSVTAQVGSGETSVVTKKDLLVRMQSPRFFVERDLVVISGNVHNYTNGPQKIRVQLDVDTDYAEFVPAADAQKFFTLTKPANEPEEVPSVKSAGPDATVDVKKDGELRVDWVLRIKREGNLKLKLTAKSASGADGMEQSFPVLVHGVERQLAKGGVLRGDSRGSVQLAIALPAERKPGSSELVVQLNPSLGATMLDALPYLVDYPYGCLEQTVSRFVPCVVVAKTLSDLGFDLGSLRERAKVLEQKAKEGDAARKGGKTVENSAYTYPKGRPGTFRVQELYGGARRWQSPVFDPTELQAMIREGLGRIVNAQNGDGGWGWWPGNSSDPYMTAYVLYSLQLAQASDVAMDAGVVDRGLAYLQGRFKEDDNFHRMAFEARVLAMAPGQRDAIRELTTGRLWENRERLSPYSRALLALALNDLGEKEKAQTLVRNIETTAQVDDDNGTANWKTASSGWWYWYHNDVETNAAVLQAYMAITPGEKLPPMLVKWLVNNRRANSWASTKASAMAVYALADYVRVNKELSPDYKLTVDLGGKVKREYAVSKENALFFDNQFIVPDELLDTGTQTLSVTKDGPGTLYYTAYTKYFSLEEPIRATSNEIAVRRRYYRIIPGTASGTPEPTPLDPERPNPFLTGKYELLSAGGEWIMPRRTEDGPRYDRKALADGEVLLSGDQIEVELLLEAKNDYEYLAFEDMKPAGCEPVELRSGSNYGGGVYSFMELKDQKVAFFIGYMPQGRRTLTYRLRAEIPGAFHVLPTNGYAMYAPDIRALSDEGSITIRDQ